MDVQTWESRQLNLIQHNLHIIYEYYVVKRRKYSLGLQQCLGHIIGLAQRHVTHFQTHHNKNSVEKWNKILMSFDRAIVKLPKDKRTLILKCMLALHVQEFPRKRYSAKWRMYRYQTRYCVNCYRDFFMNV